MHASRIIPACLVLFLLVAPLAGADDPGPCPVEVCIKAKGLDAQALASTLERTRSDLEELGARLVPGPEGGTDTVDCKQKAFIRAAHKRGAKGVIDIHVLRFGPLVRITLRIFHTATGREVLHIKAKAKSRDFPDNTSFEAVLQRGVDHLRAHDKALARKHRDTPPGKSGTGSGEPPGGREDAGKGTAGRDKPHVAARGEEIDEVPPLAPEFMVLETTAPARDTTWYWVGGTVLAGGLVLSGVGAYVLAGPFSNAMEDRDRAFDAYNLDGQSESYYEEKKKEFLDQDDKAKKLHTIGWATTGVGVALVAGGLVVVLLEAMSGRGPGPAADDTSATTGTALRPALAPALAPGGGGLLLQWSW